MSEPKRHHYVPQCYLKNFADEKGMIWVFDRKTKEYRKQSIADTAVQNHYYRIKTKDGEYSTDVEKFFSTLEAEASVIIGKLVRVEKVSQRDKEVLALFISFQRARVPDFEKLMNEADEKMMKRINEMKFHSIEATEAILKDFAEKADVGKKHDVTPEEMFEFIKEGRYSVNFPREHSIKTMLNMGYELSGYFLQMDWLFLYAPNGSSFITSDSPYTLVPPADNNPNSFWGAGVGILTPGSKKIFPVAPNVILIMGDHGDMVVSGKAPRNNMRGINLISARASDRFIFAKDEALLRFVVERSRVEEMPMDRDRVIMG